MEMVEAYHQVQWLGTSEILAAIYNTIRDPKKRPRAFKGSDFNPYAEKTRPKKTVSVAEWCELTGNKPKKVLTDGSSRSN